MEDKIYLVLQTNGGALEVRALYAALQAYTPSAQASLYGGLRALLQKGLVQRIETRTPEGVLFVTYKAL